MIRDISMIGRQGTIDDDGLVDINEQKKNPTFPKTFPAGGAILDGSPFAGTTARLDGDF